MSAERGAQFSDFVLAELRSIENSEAFLAACGGRLDLALFMDILVYCDWPTIDSVITANMYKTNFLRSEEISGYFVLENATI